MVYIQSKDFIDMEDWWGNGNWGVIGWRMKGRKIGEANVGCRGMVKGMWESSVVTGDR